MAEVYEVISKGLFLTVNFLILKINYLIQINPGSSQWSSDRLKKFAELRFKYVDEEGNEKSYFLPYIYSLLSKNSTISFAEGEKLFADI